jgi:hypothetical protein
MYKEYLTQTTNEYIIQVEILGADITKTQQFILFRNDEIKVIYTLI